MNPDKCECRIRCHGGVSILCWPVTPAVSHISISGKRNYPECTFSISRWGWFWRWFLMFIQYEYLQKQISLLWPHLTPGDHESNKLEFAPCQKAFMGVWAFQVHRFLRKFLNDPTPLSHFVIISPLKRTWSFIWTNLNFLFSRVICTKFDWNWLADSGF
jgi:hypothetical protein